MVDRIRIICEQQNLSFNKLEELSEVSKSSINKWDKNIPSIDKVLRVCAVLGVPLSAVVDDPYASAPSCHCEPVTDVTGVAIRLPSENENSLLASYRQLNEQGQTEVLNYIDYLLSKPDNQKEQRENVS